MTIATVHKVKRTWITVVYELAEVDRIKSGSQEAALDTDATVVTWESAPWWLWRCNQCGRAGRNSTEAFVLTAAWGHLFERHKED